MSSPQPRTNRRRSRRRLAGTALACIVATVALVASGCSSGSSQQPTNGPGTASQPTSQPTQQTSSQSPTVDQITSGGATPTSPSSGPSPSPSSPAVGGEVTLVTHDSFAADKQVIAEFQQRTGITLHILSVGDAGTLVNQLVLTKGNPIGDVVFGLDNTFASRALDAGVIDTYTPAAAAQGADAFGLGQQVDPDGRLTAVDYGDVCVNVDHAWFAERNVPEPTTLADLIKPAYRDLLVVESAATSSPGLAFLLGTIARYGTDGWQDYWRALMDNGTKITGDWTSAYTVDFSGSSGKGGRPLVVSYASSPPSEVPDGGTTAPTGALLDTCFRQVEYAGVLAGAANPDGARAVVDFLLSPEFQRTLPDQMYVYPVQQGTPLPASWRQFAPAAADPASLPPQQIAAERDNWIKAWSALVG